MNPTSPWHDPQFVKSYCEASHTNAYNAHYERPAIQALLPKLQNKRVLDAGCAGGALSEWLMNHGANVLAIDNSPLMIGELEARMENQIQTRVADLGQPLDFIADEEMDVVVSSLTLHYMKDWLPTLREFHRILKPNGVLVFSTHHPIMDFAKSPSGYYHAVEYIEEEWWSFTASPTKVGFYRRPLTNILDVLSESGFLLDKLVEPLPTATCEMEHPEAFEFLKRQPVFIVFCARRIQF